MTTQACVFPAEIILCILHHADPRDIVRWRTVSKWFCDITRVSVLWTTLYANAPFPRPPGPSPSQSIVSLERTLVKSARLAQSWTTRPMRDQSNVKIKLQERSHTCPIIICGRWLISHGPQEIVLYDVDAGTGTYARQVFWEHQDPVVIAWDVCSMTSTEGQILVYALLKFSRFAVMGNSPKWKLLEFRLNNESGKLRYSATVDPPRFEFNCLTQAKLHTSGKSPFIFIPTWPQAMAFDTRTRVLYALPEFDAALAEGNPPEGNQMLFTDTHLISFFNFPIPRAHLIVIQVFALPPDGSLVKSGNPVLRLTHEGIADYRLLSVAHLRRRSNRGPPHLLNFEILKSSVDPITGTTNVGLLAYTPSGDPQFVRTDLTLPEPSAVDVLPMTVEMQYINFPTNRLPRHRECFQYIDVSNNGYVRGFAMTPPPRYPRSNNYGFLKFTIDTTHDQWGLACGESPNPEWNHNSLWTSCIGFDGMRGKLYFVEGPITRYTIVILDIE